MKKTAAFFLLSLTMLSIIAPLSFSDEDLDDPDLMVFEGKVSDVDLGRSLLTVDGASSAVFQISFDTKLVSEVNMYSNDIRLSDINPGDYVSVEYLRGGVDSKEPDKVLKVSVEHGARDIEAEV
jgi:hypothetical protein